MALEALGRGALTRYRGVFIGEAQDFSTSALRFAVGLLDERYDDLMVVADAAQNIFRRKFTWEAAGINAVGRRTRTLDVNYRNTKETVELAAAFLLQDAKLSTAATPDLEDENTIVPPEKAVRNGPLPTVSIVVDEESIQLVVRQVEALLQRAQAPRGIAVLYLNRWDGQPLRDALAAANVDHFWVTDPAAPDNKNVVAQAAEPVILSTVHSAKGLEFRHVVLCCDPGQDQDLDELRRTVYVGMTRAIEQLLVVATTGHPLVEALEAAALDRARLRRAPVEPAA
ncbi:MAG: 3'-5' exonuclease [Gaiellaceae bacterium]